MTTSKESLLAHLAYRLSNQTELVATHSLAYILNRSEAAKPALGDLLRTGGANVGPVERVDAEVDGDNEGRVDLVAYNKLGEERVLIEAKFWAGLTDNQPGTYLDRLPKDDQPSVLLFVAPEHRLETLWPHLRHLAEQEFTLEVGAHPENLRTARLAGGDRHLMLTSWRALLITMASRADIEGDGSARADIRQLNALCEQQDTDGFLPIRADEFSRQVPRRLRDLRKLIDDAVARACARGFANTDRVNVTPQVYGYGRYLRLGDKAKAVWAQGWLGVHSDYWLSDGYPLWILFNGGDMGLSEIWNTLGYTHAWFELPTGKEYDEVLEAVVHDLCQHAKRVCGEIDDEDWDEYAGTQTARTRSSAKD